MGINRHAPPAVPGPAGTAVLGRTHALATAALPTVDVPTSTGLLVGQEPNGQPLLLRLFRQRPARVGAFGGLQVVGLLAFRALALGAQVVVVTPRPSAWAPLAHAAPPGPAWVTIVPPGSPTPPAGSMLRPSLLVEDTGIGQSQVRHDLGSWQTAITLEPAVTDAVAPTLASCDAALVQRPALQAVRPLQDTFGLPADALRWLPQMPDDVLALAVPGHLRFVRLVSTQVEQAVFGPPPAAGLP